MSYIDCATQINARSYQQAQYRGGEYVGTSTCITDGLSQEGIKYVNTAVNRTTETPVQCELNWFTNIFSDGLNVLDKETGLMPDDITSYINGGKFKKYFLENKTGDGSWKSQDNRMQLIEQESGLYTFNYDTDAKNGFDRSATYQYIDGLGYRKIEESFDADGDGISEVDINKSYLTDIDNNAGRKWYNIFQPKMFYSLETDTTLGVNADDLGFDSINGAHYEYIENASFSLKGYNMASLTEQKQLEVTQDDVTWYSADKPEHDVNRRS